MLKKNHLPIYTTYAKGPVKQPELIGTWPKYFHNRLQINLPYLINTVPFHSLISSITHSMQGFPSGIKSN